MERAPGTPKSPEDALVEKYGLTAGSRASFKKVAAHSPSEVPVGVSLEGTLKNTVRIGSPITFSDNSGAISQVEKMEERHGQLFIDTQTSTYTLTMERVAEGGEKFEWDDIEMVETGKGSVYRYLPDGTTQRFKKVEDRDYEPQAALVYVPHFEWVKQHATPEQLEKVGREDYIYEDNLLTYVQNPFKDGRAVYIVDATGKRVETNEEIKNAQGQIYLAFLKDDKADFFVPVSHKPIMGFSTFDTRTYRDEKTGKRMRERHLGNRVVKIVLKNGKKLE